MSEAKIELAKPDFYAAESPSPLQAERTSDLFSARGSITPVNDNGHARPGSRGNGFLPIDSHPTSADGLFKLMENGDRTPAESKLADAMKLMSGNDGDAKARLDKADPLFKDAVSVADAALKGISDKAKAMSPTDIAMANQQFATAKQVEDQLQAALDGVQVPPSLKGQISQDDLRSKLKSEVEAFLRTKPGDDYAFRGLEKDLQQFPVIHDLAARDKNLGESEPFKSVMRMAKDYEHAYADAALTRLAYSRALKAGGKETESWQQLKDAMAMFGQKLPDHPPGMLDVKI